MEVVLTPFHVPLWEALALVHSSDVFLGMHGAGFTNLLGMHKVGPLFLDSLTCVIELQHARGHGVCNEYRLRMEAERAATRCHRAQRDSPWAAQLAVQHGVGGLALCQYLPHEQLQPNRCPAIALPVFEGTGRHLLCRRTRRLCRCSPSAGSCQTAA